MAGYSDRDPDGGSPPGRDDDAIDPETDVLEALRDGPTRFVPPRTEATRRELRIDGGQLLHCLACGRQVVARRHGGSCLLCGSEAVIVESV